LLMLARHASFNEGVGDLVYGSLAMLGFIGAWRGACAFKIRGRTNGQT